MELEKLLHSVVAGVLLANECKSAADGRADADKLLEATDGETIDSS